MLKIKDLVFQVSDEDRTLGILQGITLTIPDNKFVVITGPPGTRRASPGQQAHAC